MNDYLGLGYGLGSPRYQLGRCERSTGVFGSEKWDIRNSNLLFFLHQIQLVFHYGSVQT